MRIRLDMDGVIANFTKQACKTMGEPYPSEHVFTNYSWLFDKHGKHSCYKRMKGHLFWTSVEAFPWATDMINMVDEESKGNWMFLTKPMVDPYCYSGKAEWVMKYARQHLDKLCIIAADKSNVVRDKKDVLIDDKIGNIESWNAAGGTGYFWEEISDDFNTEAVESRLLQLRKTLQEIKSI